MTAVICPNCGFGGDIEDMLDYNWDDNLCAACSENPDWADEDVEDDEED